MSKRNRSSAKHKKNAERNKAVSEMLEKVLTEEKADQDKETKTETEKPAESIEREEITEKSAESVAREEITEEAVESADNKEIVEAAEIIEKKEIKEAELVTESRPELVYEKHIENTKKSSHKEDKLRFTLLLIPNNHHRVREARFSADFLITVTSVIALIVIIFAISITLGAKQWQEYKDTAEEQYDTIKALQDENIVLESEVEELKATLREAKVAIDVSKNIQQKEAEKQSEATKPSALPVAGGASLPSEYTEEKGYVEFNAPAGGKVVATADGVISMVMPNDQYGYIVKVDHGNGYVTTYMIDCVPQVSEKDKVVKGSTLFSLGENGATLAYQITFNDVAINPMSVIEVNG